MEAATIEASDLEAAVYRWFCPWKLQMWKIHLRRLLYTEDSVYGSFSIWQFQMWKLLSIEDSVHKSFSIWKLQMWEL